MKYIPEFSSGDRMFCPAFNDPLFKLCPRACSKLYVPEIGTSRMKDPFDGSG